MFSPTENFYAAWRTQSPAAQVLHDENGAPSERLLQAVWLHQRLSHTRLKTDDGNSLRVFHPGFISVEGGPDFCGAVIQIGDEAPRTGDVEVDLSSAGWRAHGHDKNKSFQNVILHVVWDEKKSGSAETVPSVLSLKNVLDAPLEELGLALENEPRRSLPENLRGRCAARLRELSEARLAELLQAAARVRFENKAAAMLARAKNSGWEQVLWEHLFRALGYKHNVWPMQHLAETKSRWLPGAHGARAASIVFELQARLLGVSGLLPGELTRTQKSSNTFLRRAWDAWWRERDELESCILPRAAWKFHGLRPANHPQRRLALAAHWLASENFISKIENWCMADLPDKKLLDSLHEIFQVERDEFWSWRWTLKSARLAKPQPLLGATRVTDLAVNVVLPWLWIRAKEGGNEKIRREMERRFLAWPPAEDNSVLKLARQRLFGTGKLQTLRMAVAQQGLMQIVRDFCGHSNALCDDCRFPELVQSLKSKAQSQPSANFGL
jgi:Protein of unknown function (DUF2851)